MHVFDRSGITLQRVRITQRGSRQAALQGWHNSIAARSPGPQSRSFSTQKKEYLNSQAAYPVTYPLHTSTYVREAEIRDKGYNVTRGGYNRYVTGPLGRRTWHPPFAAHPICLLADLSMLIWWSTERSVQGNLYERTTKLMDRDGFAKVSRWYRSICYLAKVWRNTAKPYHCWHHHYVADAVNPALQLDLCESFVNVPRELRKSWGWDSKG